MILGAAQLHLGGNVGPKIALIDTADWAAVSARSWWPVWQTKAEYWSVLTKIRRGDERQNLSLHRFLMPDAEFIIFLNRNTLDNRRDNLRSVDREGLNAHRGPVVGCTYKGVTCDPERQRWRARIKVKGEWRHLGRYDTPEEAARAYDREALVAWGDVAYLNFPR